MLSLLDPRVWMAIALAVAFAASNVWSYRHGKTVVRAEVAQKVAEANREARAMERKRQENVDEAQRLAAAREARNRSDAVNARRAADGLRGDLDAVRLHSEKSLAAAIDANRTLGDILQQCTDAYLSVASEADRAYSEALTLRMAWPK